MEVAFIAIILLMLASAFFSGSETALTAVSRSLMHQLESEGDSRAKRVNRLLLHKDRLLGALLLGNNLVNILASALATSALIELFGEAGIAYATAGMTVLVVIFSEVLPKTYAIHAADRMALVVARPVDWTVFLLRPVVQMVNLIVRGLLRLLGVRASGIRDIDLALTELRGAIELHASQEEVHDERAMLRSILDLGDIEVGRVMTHRRAVTALNADMPSSNLVELILASPHTRIPLWRDNPDNIVGVIHAKALLRALHGRSGNAIGLNISALMTPPWFVPDTTKLSDQLQAFRDRREHFALVVDEYGALLGIITLEDIIEEIVGDITDEHDIAVPGVRAQNDGSCVVDGKVPIRDLNRQFDWRLPDEDAATIAGLLLHEARRIPDVGQIYRFHGFRFEILRRHRNHLTLLRITPPAMDKDES